MYKIVFHKDAVKDIEYLKASNLDIKAKSLIEMLRNNPFSLPYEKLKGDLEGLYSKRINIKHRLVYRVDITNKTVYILRMWNHYQ